MNEVYDYSANIKKYKLIGVFQLIFLAVCAYTFLTDFRLFEFFIGLTLAYFIGTFGIAIFYHRILSHKVIEIKNVFKIKISKSCNIFSFKIPTKKINLRL